MFKSRTKIHIDYYNDDDFTMLASIHITWWKKYEMYEITLCSATKRLVASATFREWSNVLGLLSVIETLPKFDKSFLTLVKLEMAERQTRI